MSKAILVIDMPERCSKCKFAYEFYGIKKCHLLNHLCNGGKAILSLEEYTKKRSDKCPLVLMPGKKENYLSINNEKGFCEGWNACIDTIGGKESDRE